MESRIKFGGILQKKVAQGSVTFSGPDSNGIVTWTFKNTGNATGSWLLQRGASLAGVQFEDYVFGQAFNVVYLYNGSLFGTSLLTAPPTPLVDNGVNNNSPPMAIVDSPSGRSICFIFTLSPGQTWSMLEGGFSGGIVPSNPVLIPVTVENPNPQPFCDAWNSEQCQGFNQQTGSNLPCPPNPWTIQSILMQTDVNIPILIQDTITNGACTSGGGGGQQTCLQQIEDGISSGNLEEIIEGIICYLEQAGMSVTEFVIKFWDHYLALKLKHKKP